MTRWTLSYTGFFLVTFCVMTCYAKEEPVLEPATEFIHAAVRVNNPNVSCGTIVGGKDNKIYVLSTGHLDKRTTPEVEVFYQHGLSLKRPLVLTGRVVFLVENGINNGIDFSLIEIDVGNHRNFNYIKITSPKYELKNKSYISIGCDMGIEPKVFDAKVVNTNLMTEGDKVQAGRSGGGLFDPKNKKLVGVCWGRTLKESKGLFTSHKDICTLLNAAKYGFLIDEGEQDGKDN